MFKKLLLLCVCLVVVAAGAVFYVKNQMDTYLGQTVSIQEPTLVTIESGTSFNSILRRFETDNWIQSADADYVAKLIRRLHPEVTQLKAGTFELEPNLSLKDALLSLVNGKEAQFSITFVEGSTFKEWRTQFDEAPHLVHSTVDMSEQEIAKELGIERDKLEGLFLANTYHYTVGMSDLDIMRRANSSLNQTLEKYWGERQDKLPLKNAYEALSWLLLSRKRRQFQKSVRWFLRYL